MSYVHSKTTWSWSFSYVARIFRFTVYFMDYSRKINSGPFGQRGIDVVVYRFYCISEAFQVYSIFLFEALSSGSINVLFSISLLINSYFCFQTCVHYSISNLAPLFQNAFILLTASVMSLNGWRIHQNISSSFLYGIDIPFE